jgi:hypothetical protein
MGRNLSGWGDVEVRRPSIPEGEGRAFIFLNSEFYWANGTHPMIMHWLQQHGVDMNELTINGIAGYVWNMGHEAGVPDFQAEFGSDFHQMGNDNAESECWQRLIQLFPDITRRGQQIDHDAFMPSTFGKTAVLQGLPENAMGPHPEIQQVAQSYMQKMGLPYNPPTNYQMVDPNFGKQIANQYQAMEHNPDDPKVRQSYDALKYEALQQYQHAVDNGFKFEFYPEDHDPYPNGPRQALEDLHNNRHLYVYPTDAGFGMDANYKDHPLLEDSGIRWNGKPVTYNDIFRGIHDFYGHAKEGVGFRHDGEDNAYRQHAAMFSDAARPAMTSETRGQNSWVNFGPYGEHNQTANQQNTIYADQKAGIMPDWTMQDSRLSKVADDQYFDVQEIPTLVPEGIYEKHIAWVYDPDNQILYVSPRNHHPQLFYQLNMQDDRSQTNLVMGDIDKSRPVGKQLTWNRAVDESVLDYLNRNYGGDLENDFDPTRHKKGADWQLQSKTATRLVDLGSDFAPHAHDMDRRRTYIYVPKNDTLYLAGNNAYHTDLYYKLYETDPDYKDFYDEENYHGFVDPTDHVIEYYHGRQLPLSALHLLEEQFGHLDEHAWVEPVDWSSDAMQGDPFGWMGADEFLDPTEQWPTHARQSDWRPQMPDKAIQESLYFHRCPMCGGYLTNRGDFYTCSACPFEWPPGGEKASAVEDYFDHQDDALPEGEHEEPDRPPKFEPGDSVQERAYGVGGTVQDHYFHNGQWHYYINAYDSQGPIGVYVAIEDDLERPGRYDKPEQSTMKDWMGIPPEAEDYYRNASICGNGQIFRKSDTIDPIMTPENRITQTLVNDEAANVAFDALTQAGGTVYVVGGAVRDAVLGNNPKDIDLMVTGLTGDQVAEALGQVGRVDLTGKQFGVYRLRKGAGDVEVALPRTEQSTGTGHKDFDVQADPNLPIEDDLRRRDFTVNAMAYNPREQKIVDPYGGTTPRDG